MFILKKHLGLMWRDLDTSLLPCSSYLFVSLILLRKFALISPGTRSSSHEEKNKLTKFVYVLGTKLYEYSIF